MLQKNPNLNHISTLILIDGVFNVTYDGPWQNAGLSFSYIYRLLGVLCESGFMRLMWDLNLMSVMDQRYFTTNADDDLEVSYFATRRPSK